jgi:uncharacterized protein (TIGR03032 family)
MAAESTSPSAESPFHAVHSPGLPDLLKSAGISLLVTTYQANRLMSVREAEGKIWTLLRDFDRPMGLAIRGDRQFALGTRKQIWDFRNVPRLTRGLDPTGYADACYLPRQSLVTGDILGHEMAWLNDELWITNTLFSCLCTLHADFSFVPRWRPPFITESVAEDRCHLNGFTALAGQPRYATALGETNTLAGWRPGKADGGILIDIPSGEVIARGLSMPHSPRIREGQVWLVEGGTGRLIIVERITGKREVVAELPGFPRGLTLFGSYAFVGLSKIRETAQFGGLPIAEFRKDLQCGVWVVDVNAGRIVEFMRFESGVEEIFAVEPLVGIRFPEIVGFQGDSLEKAYVLPD